jgi:hypothetical protein
VYVWTSMYDICIYTVDDNCGDILGVTETLAKNGLYAYSCV